MSSESRRSSLLHGLVEVARVRAADVEDLTPVMQQVAEVLGETLGLGLVIINTYRPAWDDFVVSAVHGTDEARRVLLGATYPWRTWHTLLDERFNIGGAYFLPHGALNEDVGPRYVPEREEPAGDGAWHPEDELSVPFRRSDGELIGVLNVGEPLSGRRLSPQEVDVLVVAAEHLGLAIEAAQETSEGRAQRDALAALLAVSAELGQLDGVGETLERVCQAIHVTLGFGKVAVQLTDVEAGVYRPMAQVGWTPDEPGTGPIDVQWLAPLLDPCFDAEGCYLVSSEEARRRVTVTEDVYRSQNNGVGRWAWDRHWLVVPLHGRDQDLIGVIWADEPDDRLLPARWKLQALRLFADLCASAAISARERAQLAFLADHDPLTGLLNRRAFTRELEREAARAERSGTPFTLLLLDLDGFKELNDRHGHQVGDAALRAVGAALLAELRAGDVAFRLGGDEFAVVLSSAPITTSTAAGRRLVARVLARLDGVRASVGVATWQPGLTPDALVRRADDDLYRTKRARIRRSAS